MNVARLVTVVRASATVRLEVADVASAVAAPAALQATWTEKKQKNTVTHDEKQTTG